MSTTVKLYQTTTIRKLERLAIEKYTIAEQDLMERAGEATFHALRQRWPKALRLLVACGGGNNGGDGFVLARLAASTNIEVILLLLVDPRQLKGVAKIAYERCREVSGIQYIGPDHLDADRLGQADVIVDAMLGIGIEGEVRARTRKLIEMLNASPTPVLAIDAPSGLNVDTGNIQGIAVEAAVTVTFIAPKLGLYTGKGTALSGDILCADLGLPPAAYKAVHPAAEIISTAEIKAALPKRERDAHKGAFGHVLVIGGDLGMPGAARMAAEAALRVGAGLVSVATRPEHITAICSTRPEIMVRGVSAPDELERLCQRATVIAIGPGLGQSAWSQALFNFVMKCAQPKVVDADALNLLAQHCQKHHDWILTPHPAEAGRLLQCEAKDIQQDRLQSVTTLQHRYGGVAVLKGAGTLVKGEEGLVGLCQAGNPGMATAGMGDILSGVCAGLLAQGLALTQAARIGVLIHAQAADHAAQHQGERGLLATDLLPILQQQVNFKGE